MNLISKSLIRVAFLPISHLRIGPIPSRKWVISQQVRFSSAAVNGKPSGGGRKPRAKAPAKPPETAEKEFTRPREIAYQPEVANWVNLIGFVDQPVQFEASPDGKFWAGTVISQRSGSDSSAFWVPVIFEGDLAKVAARYIKKDDQIHLSGKLFIDSPPPNITYAQANVQVMVQNLNFVQRTTPAMTDPSSDNGESSTKKRPGRPKKATDEASSTLGRPKGVTDEASDTWKNLLENSKDEASSSFGRPKRVTDEASDTWKNLLENSKDWWDHRDNKANGLVKPRHPDFKRKDGSLSLWLNKAPDWVLPQLEAIKFDVPLSRTREAKQRTREESWKDLVQNPDKWWDNRTDKRNAKAPDFKHKETGEALWLNESPAWVLSELPPLKRKQERVVVG